MVAGSAETGQAQGRKDFFISYTGKDRAWAEWIAFELEAPPAKYTVIVQAWDIRPGSNFVIEMDKAAKLAERTIAVLSPAYFASNYTPSEWAAAFRRDPKGELGLLVPVRVEDCDVEGLLGSIVYIDLVSNPPLDDAQARERLLTGVKRGRAKPAGVSFPGLSSPTVQVSLDRPRPAFPGSLPSIWNVPYRRNPLFTGRDDILKQITANLQVGQLTALSQPQAISGLGGIGKTQIALEYAYRARQDYQAVLWAQADTREALTSSFLSIATLLNLPQKDETESARVVEAIKNWLQTQTGYLLILDNADDLQLARDILPTSFGGHVLLTTRAQAMGRFARHLEVETLSAEHGVLFLLRRAARLAEDAPLETATEQERNTALLIHQELGGLPLALDQAGAYIEETGCSLIDYLHLFQRRRADLLAERGGLIDDHPQSVATTWSLSFQRVEAANPAAADLIRLCAFLAPDAIPETIITEGAPHLGPHLAPVAADLYLLNKAIDPLRTYSLLSRESSSEAGNSLSVHRLVQAVLKDQLDEPNTQLWTERAVQAVNAALPAVEHGRWSQWEQVLPHALACSELIEQQNFYFAEAADLLRMMGWYLVERVRYRESEPLLRRALSINEQYQGGEHLSTATSLNNLAYLYERQGKYGEAEPVRSVRAKPWQHGGCVAG
jgi:hypothetical protein